MADRYEWDSAKRGSNLAKHGIDFNEIARFEWATATVVPDRRVD
ncbi:BrnT family toxin, partial [uncultured Amaricoccus sp.]